MKIIAVNYNYEPYWLLDKDYLIYDRSDSAKYLNLFDKKRIIKTKNIGNADYDRLTYLIDNYDKLPKVFMLTKSNLFRFIEIGQFDKLKRKRTFTPLLKQTHKVYEPICRYVKGMYEEINNSWYAPQFERKFNTYNDWADYMKLPKPDYLAFAPGGNYILTPKEVHKRPKKFYIRMRTTLKHAVLPAEAHYVERSLYTLWK